MQAWPLITGRTKKQSWQLHTVAAILPWHTDFAHHEHCHLVYGETI